MSQPPPVRRIGRILALGMPLPGTRVDNYNFLSAPSFFDYDALVVDMQALVHLVESVVAGSLEPETFGRQRVCANATSPDEVSLLEVLLRRRTETERLLANDGVVVVSAQPPVVFRGITGAPELSSYWWLPAAGGVRYEDHLLQADGAQAQIVDYQHPMARFIQTQIANVAYRARLDVENIPSFADRGRVFVRSAGGAAIGVEVPADRGRIVLLPALKSLPAGDARYTASELMQAGIRRMLGVMAEGREPPWLTKHPLPRLEERATALQEAEAARQEAQLALDEASAAHAEIAQYRALLWQEGVLGLEPVVVAALKLIGFKVYDANPEEIEIRVDDTTALVEIDASDSAVGMAAHYRLRQRIERAIERRGSAPRGLLLINGHRLKPPTERPAQVSDALKLAAETMRYGIATTASLFDAVQAQMAGDAGSVAQYRASLLTTDGMVEASSTD